MLATRCISCRENAEVEEWMFMEPFSAEDITAVTLRGFICHNCAVVHWAYPPPEKLERG